MKRIFVCFTKLHVDISMSILNQTCLKDEILILHFTDATDFNCSRSINNYQIISVNIRSIAGLYCFLKLVLDLRFLNKDSFLYLGNAKRLVSTLFVALSGVSRINTFDDGIGHLIGKGYFYELEENVLLKRVLVKIFPSLSYSHLISKVDKHFTIFSVGQNLSWGHCFGKQVCKVNLDIAMENDFAIDFDLNKKDLIIFLGSTFHQDGHLTNQCEKSLENDIISKLKVDIYIPHPRRKKDSLGHVKSKILFPDDLSSEQCVSYLVKEGYQLTVMAINSTGLLTISAQKNVRVMSIRTPLVSSNVYTLFDSIGIEVIDL